MPDAGQDDEPGTTDRRGGAPGGRGLFLATLSTNWSWYPTRQPPGKVTWCELAPQLDGHGE